MKRTTLLVLLFASATACAQINPCTGKAIPAGTMIDWYGDITDAHPFACAPLKSATSTDPTMRQNNAGVLAYWYCKVGTGWRLQKNAVTWDFLTGKNMAANMRAALHAPDPLSAFQQTFMAQTHLPLSDPSLTPVWCPWADEMWKNTPAADPAPPPPPGPDVWRANGSTIYVVSSGKLSPLYATVSGVLTIQKAAVNALCDGNAPPLQTGYLPLIGGPTTQVTACKKVPQ